MCVHSVAQIVRVCDSHVCCKHALSASQTIVFVMHEACPCILAHGASTRWLTWFSADWALSHLVGKSHQGLRTHWPILLGIHHDLSMRLAHQLAHAFLAHPHLFTHTHFTERASLVRKAPG